LLPPTPRSLVATTPEITPHISLHYYSITPRFILSPTLIADIRHYAITLFTRHYPLIIVIFCYFVTPTLACHTYCHAIVTPHTPAFFVTPRHCHTCRLHYAIVVVAITLRHTPLGFDADAITPLRFSCFSLRRPPLLHHLLHASFTHVTLFSRHITYVSHIIVINIGYVIV